MGVRVAIRHPLFAAALVLVASLLLVPRGAEPARRTQVPTVLWAWERPEDLRFVPPERYVVAYLAATLDLVGERIAVRPRLHRLVVPEGLELVPVVRIETGRGEPATLSAWQLAETAAVIASLPDLAGASRLQIDFDARVSERDFYRRLLLALADRLEPGQSISITALASWCIGDRWLDGLEGPRIAAVPMLFRMGPDAAAVRARLDRGDDFPARSCRAGIGVSADEPIPRLPSGRPLYLFSPRPWTPAELANLETRLRRSP